MYVFNQTGAMLKIGYEFSTIILTLSASMISRTDLRVDNL